MQKMKSPQEIRYIIYCWTHIKSGMKYVGMTKHSIEYRLKSHLISHQYFGYALRKHGIDAFTCETLCEIKTLNEAYEREIFYIAELDTQWPNGYNIYKGGAGEPGHGWKADERTIRARVLAMTGRKNGPHSAETKRKISIAKRNNKVYLISENFDETYISGIMKKLILILKLNAENGLSIEEMSLLMKPYSTISDYELRRKITYYVNKFESCGILQAVKEKSNSNLSAS